MSSTRKIIIFDLGSGIKNTMVDEGEIAFYEKASPNHLASGDIIIYLVGSFKYTYTHDVIWGNRLQNISSQAIRREKEIYSAIEKGKIVCFVGNHCDDYVVSGVLRTYSIGHDYFNDSQVQRNLTIKRSEFKSFLDDVGASNLWFCKDGLDEIICYANGESITGFCKEIGKGKLFFIPCVWGSSEAQYFSDHLKLLIKGIVAYSVKRVIEPPSYIANYKFTNEEKLEETIKEITLNQIVPLQTRLNHYNELKKILWLGDNNLVKATCEFLGKTGLHTLIDEIYEEDFWIIDDKEKIVIIEVKGLNNNLTRQDISKLDEHREARQVPNLTGLLITNTFMKADSLKEKDIDFPPNVIEKAVTSNLLITRTLDLCKILDYLEQNKLPVKTLLDILIGKKGWLTFRNGKIDIIT